MFAKLCLVAGALLGGSAVALGAFESHGLKARLAAQQVPEEVAARRLENAQTAGRYQMVHALALIAVGLAARQRAHTLWAVAALAWLLGSLLFSGILHYFALTGSEQFVRLVPVGGVLLIAGWLAFGLAALGSGEPGGGPSPTA